LRVCRCGGSPPRAPVMAARPPLVDLPTASADVTGVLSAAGSLSLHHSLISMPSVGASADVVPGIVRVSCAGTLLKRPASGWGPWKRRYFRVRGTQLSCADAPEAATKWTLDLSAAKLLTSAARLRLLIETRAAPGGGGASPRLRATRRRRRSASTRGRPPPRPARARGWCAQTPKAPAQRRRPAGGAALGGRRTLAGTGVGGPLGVAAVAAASVGATTPPRARLAQATGVPPPAARRPCAS